MTLSQNNNNNDSGIALNENFCYNTLV